MSVPSAPPASAALPAPPKPVLGALWMLAAGVSFVAMTILVRYSGQGLPAAQSAFLRFAFGLVFLLPVLAELRARPPSGRILRLITLRSVIHSLAVAGWFYAMTKLPLAEVTAMNYLTPIYVTLGAALLLGEKLAPRRIAAVLVALAGAMVILRPGLRAVEPAHLAMLFTTVCLALSYLIAKRLSDDLSPAIVVAWLSIGVTIVLAPFAIAAWTPASAAQLVGLFFVSGVATLGHYAMTRAFRLAPVSVTQPVAFLQIVWAVLFGVVLFGEPVDPWVVAGAGLIIGATAWVTLREAQLSRRAAAALAHQP